ncbi:MAG: DNA-processing protein DprA [Spirochaetales bacterium]|nr:DNA-processing protein DprA [Spirochaetales bacterium]
MSCTNELLFLAINRASFLKPRDKLLLAEVIPSVSVFLKISGADVGRCLGRMVHAAKWEPENFLKFAEYDRKYLTKANIKYTFYSEEKYPAPLREIYDPPLVLYYRGNDFKCEQPLVAVVGTRRPTGEASMRAYGLGVELSASHVGVVSGLAKGIDTAVHSGCVSIGGYGIAVMGNGIDMVYPGSSKATAFKLLDNGGTLTSEYPPGEPPHKYHFPERNRIISGLARAVVVVQAPKKSGALITADFALEQGRELYVHKVGLKHICGEGTAALHGEGAVAIDSAYAVIKDLKGQEPMRKVHEKKIKITGNETKDRLGHELADLLELEINDKVSVFNGEYYWSE